MDNNCLDPELIAIGALFDEPDAVYTVPIYQRNYAWQAEQIEQMLRDIMDAADYAEDGYFLGNLMVTRLQGGGASFEVIDGQQRLTTLYLLLAYLTHSKNVGAAPFNGLRYESRPRAAETLRRIASGYALNLSSVSNSPDSEDAGIRQGYNVIRQFMVQHFANDAQLSRFEQFLRTKVTVVRASLPARTDFNRYFEIMNTRGQQLEQTDIVKARLMQWLDGEAQRTCFAWIWDSCADMDSYVQMALTRGRPDLRTKIFGEEWSWLAATGFDQLLQVHMTAGAVANLGSTSSISLTLDGAIAMYEQAGASSAGEDPDNVRFRSTIDFPAFLLHVLDAASSDGRESERRLDAAGLIKRFGLAVSGRRGEERQWVQDFALSLLRCRNLFDNYVLKRQYTAANSEEGDWSLQKLVKRRSRDKAVPGYRNTFSPGSGDWEEDCVTDPATTDVLMLESMLRVTYTSPRTMHWITLLLRRMEGGEPGELAQEQLVAVLREYARGKVREAFFDGAQPEGFSVGRIVFTYLDYLLWTDRRDLEFRFMFRNSIEHFYPQHPDEQQSGSTVSEGILHWLGNLALVSVGTNSKFSNSLPSAKAINFQGTIEKQSPKLQQMARIAREDAWGDAQVRAHHSDMVKRLESDIRADL